MARNRRHMKFGKQAGATVVEYALTLLLFLIVIFAIVEFSLAVFDWSKQVEAVRAGVRQAIVVDPACDIFEKDNTLPGCSGTLVDCTPGTTSVVVNCDGLTTGGCVDIVGEMQKILPTIQASNVSVEYICTDVGDPEFDITVPTVSVTAADVPHVFILPWIFRGTDVSGYEMPDYTATRVGEDLFTTKSP